MRGLRMVIEAADVKTILRNAVLLRTKGWTGGGATTESPRQSTKGEWV